jgi:small subunit ribosomal protein S3
MGQKINPISLRVGVIRTWDSRWYANADYAKNLHEDIKIRAHVQKSLKQAGVAKVEIERAAQKVKVIISTARPGVVIGKKGAGIDKIRLELQKFSKSEVFVSIQEVRKPDLDAQLVAANIAMQLEKRISWRRALKKAIAASTRGGVRGIKVKVGGRLDGAEIARSEWYNEKSVPLHTLRADVDYGTAEALTSYGILGVKVWIYRGDVLSMREAEEVGRA